MTLILSLFSATVEQLNCPVGTYNNETGKGFVTDCRPCNPGYYCLEGSITPTGPCDKGFYCPSPITNTFSSSPPMIGSYGSRQVRIAVSVCLYVCSTAMNSCINLLGSSTCILYSVVAVLNWGLYVSHVFRIENCRVRNLSHKDC